MPNLRRSHLLLFFSLILTIPLFAQDSTVYKWTVTSKKISDSTYELNFSTNGAPGWQLYAPQDLSGLNAAELLAGDSGIQNNGLRVASGNVKQLRSDILETEVKLMEGPAAWTSIVTINGAVPASLQGKLLYTFGRGDELYPGTSFSFRIPLEGGHSEGARILVPSIDINKPVAACGDEDATDKTIWKIFGIGFGAGLLALLFPCIFPLIPLTVSFFTKRSKTRMQGLKSALLYGFSIFVIYTALSLPFHLFNMRPEVLNNISTNVPLNIAFFIVFIVFAISFFGYFEIGLPGSLANKLDARAGIGDIWGIFFMALTLAVVSFSCTSGILGALMVGAISSEGGAWQLTAGMGGFGLGLGLPFVLFALFPNWLQSLPRSGGWMGELKVVFGFIELAMAIKFLSNADLVKQWGLLPREIFLGAWVLIGIAIVLYLLGWINFPHDSKRKFGFARWSFIILFGAITAYLVPGMFNTKSAGLTLISGMPPPLEYSIYPHAAAASENPQPIHNDYEGALAKARAENKPLLIDFTGWACVNCRRMEENIWPDAEVKRLMKDSFVLVSLYVDERKNLPAAQRQEYRSKKGDIYIINTVGDLWASFQSENFGQVSQPQYAIISPDEKALTRTKTYTQSPSEFREWLECGLAAFRNRQ